MEVDFFQQCFRLVFQEAKTHNEAHILAVNYIHVLIDNYINTARKRQQPVIGVVEFGDFSFFVRQKRQVIELVLGDKVAVRFGGITA